jgi:alkanesulfonate monooxygenase SsuD/methylene tetrahydromethanopterin reductase-like flavin-dependent oxidoreductase (luciferase family)
MKFFAFHLMPYRHLDHAEAGKYRSYWSVLPNRLYDPALGADLYQEYIDQLVFAAKLGFDGVCVNEHHQTAYGLMPAPNLIASILIDRTRGMNTRIPIIGRALPLLNNPLTVAEEYAMLDALSHGRVVAGFVRGIGCEYHASGVNPIYSHERFHEAHDLIIRAWTEPGPFEYEGEHYNFRYVNTWPRPVQQPHPLIWIPSQGSAETIEWASHPDRRYPFIITFSPYESVMRFHDLYKEAARQQGYEAAGEQLGWAVPVYVAESDEIAIREAAEHIEALFNNYLYMPTEMVLPPGYTSIKSMKAILATKKGMTTVRQTMKDILEKGTFLVGSPETVREKIERAHARSGVKTLVPMIQFGTLPDALVRKSVEMFAKEVMPKLRGVGEGAAAQRAAE